MVELISEIKEAAEAIEATESVAEIEKDGIETANELGRIAPDALQISDLEANGYFNVDTLKLKMDMINVENAEKFESELPAQLEACNPNYELDECWQINCQRCVPTYEMRMRGYDVTAKPCLDDFDHLSFEPFDVWEDAEVIECEGNGLDQIKEQMAEWGDGARAQIVVSWDGTNSGHTFVAEQVNGKTRFFDPQTHETEVEYYFDMVRNGSVEFCRMDQLAVNEKYINKCCENVEV